MQELMYIYTRDGHIVEVLTDKEMFITGTPEVDCNQNMFR